MTVLNEDTFSLLCLIEQNEAIYDDCYRITAQVLERDLPRGESTVGIGDVAAAARSKLSAALKRLVRYCEDDEIQEHLAGASIDWRDVARELIADVLCVQDE